MTLLRRFLSILFSISLLAASFIVPQAAWAVDLVVADVQVNDECRLDITIKNIGAPTLANLSFGVRVQAVKDGKGAGGYTTPITNSPAFKQTGGGLTYHLYPLVISGPTEVRIEVDVYRKVPESDEDNNRMIRTVTCGASENTPKKENLKTLDKKGLQKRTIRRLDRKVVPR